jgi:hypothetical protein
VRKLGCRGARTVPLRRKTRAGLDQGSQSCQRRGAAGAQRELGQVIPGPG